MTSPHADSPEENAPPGGLSPDDFALLAPDAARSDHSPNPAAAERAALRTDWEAVVLSIRDRTAPARREASRQRTDRQRRIDSERRRRVILATLDRLDRRFARYSDAQVDGQPIVARWVLSTIQGARDGLVLRGPVGCGKTHLAVAAYRACVAGGVLPAVAVTVPALLDGLRPGREPVEELRACEDARLLLLDDLAAERSTDWTAETLYRLVDARYARRLPTIITTNATGAMIREHLGDRIASRLNGIGPVVSWPTDAPDRRVPTRN
jgi:DNA replication protein DnaC